MTLAIENFVNQIAKTLFSQKKLLLSFVQSQNNTQINKFSQQYQAELEKLKAINEEFYSKRSEKVIGSESNIINNGTNEDQINQLKSQMELVKSELTYLKSKKESLESLKERVDVLEQTYSIFKKNQDFCSDFQFNEFLTVYNSTMECTRESIRMNHEDIMKLKAITHHLQQKPDMDSILNSVRCLKHEIKLLKQHSPEVVNKSPNENSHNAKVKDSHQSIEEIKKNENHMPAKLSDFSNFKAEINEIKNQLKKFNEIDSKIKNLTDLVSNQNSGSDSTRPINDKSAPLNNLTQKQISNLEQQHQEFKQMKTSIGCIKHEMRTLKVLFEDNARIATQVDTLFEKYKKIKERMKLENSSPNSPKRSSTISDEESTQQIRKDLQILKQNFVETFSMQNSSIANQSDRIKALQKSIDEILSKSDKNTNERLKIIETKLQIITSLAGSS